MLLLVMVLQYHMLHTASLLYVAYDTAIQDQQQRSRCSRGATFGGTPGTHADSGETHECSLVALNRVVPTLF